MAGLVPAIGVHFATEQGVDHRVKPGDDDYEDDDLLPTTSGPPANS
jgi:hypothetical protein